MMAYQLIVPHAYPSIDSEVAADVKMPLIINVPDPYADTDSCHILQDISGHYALKMKMLLCHESQIFEWLPWSGGKKSFSRKDLKNSLAMRHSRTNENHGIADDVPREYFSFTQWGRKIERKDVDILFSSTCVITPEGKKAINMPAKSI